MAETLPTTWWVEIINKKEFAKMAINENVKTFVIQIASFSLRQIMIYPAQEVQIALLVAKKVTVLAEYSNFADIFLKKSIAKLFKCFNINEYLIDLKPGKQLYYGLIYSLGPVELETLKTYIEINLANDFI